MIGKNELILDASDFVKGMSSGDDIADGGFSNSTDAVNLIANPGVLYAPANVTDKSGTLAGNIIASSGDANVSGNSRYFLTDTGKFFTWDDSSLTLRQTDAVKSYVTGTSDMVQFRLQTFASSATDITLLTGSDLATIDAVWWTTTKGKAALQTSQRHPLLVYENSLWIGDKSSLHKWDGTTASEAVLALSTEQSIVSLGIDAGSGRMLIGITEGTNYSNTKPHISKVLEWDGFSNKPLRAVIVEDAVNAFYNISGTTFVTYGQKMGYWNGSGITFLRKFKNVTLAGADLAYKHHITNIGQTLYIVDGSKVLAWGEVLPGQKAFYYAQSNNVSAANYSCIANIGSNLLGLCFNTAKFYTFDTTSIATTGTMSFVTNKYNFPRPVYIRGAYFEYSDAVTAADNNRQLYYKTQAQGAGFVLIQDPTATTGVLKNLSASSVYEITPTTFGISANKVKFIQFRYNTDTVNLGLRRIIIYYDIAE